MSVQFIRPLSLLVTLDVNISRAIKVKLAEKVFKVLLFPTDESLSFLDFLDDGYFQFFFLVIYTGSYSRCIKGRSEAYCPSSSLLVPIKQIFGFNDKTKKTENQTVELRELKEIAWWLRELASEVSKSPLKSQNSHPLAVILSKSMTCQLQFLYCKKNKNTCFIWLEWGLNETMHIEGSAKPAMYEVFNNGSYFHYWKISIKCLHYLMNRYTAESIYTDFLFGFISWWPFDVANGWEEGGESLLAHTSMVPTLV